MSPPPLHHLLHVLDSALSPLALLHLYQLHIRISQTVLLPVLFPKYVTFTFQNSQEHVYIKCFMDLLVCFRYIWPLAVMQGICWLGRQLLAGGMLICICKHLRCIPSSYSISHQASRCGERRSGFSQGYFQTLSSWVSWSSWAGETFGQSVVYSSRSLKDSPVPRVY